MVEVNTSRYLSLWRLAHRERIEVVLVESDGNRRVVLEINVEQGNPFVFRFDIAQIEWHSWPDSEVNIAVETETDPRRLKLSMLF